MNIFFYYAVIERLLVYWRIERLSDFRAGACIMKMLNHNEGMAVLMGNLNLSRWWMSEWQSSEMWLHVVCKMGRECCRNPIPHTYIFYCEDRVLVFLRNISTYLSKHLALHRRRLLSLLPAHLVCPTSKCTDFSYVRIGNVAPRWCIPVRW